MELAHGGPRDCGGLSRGSRLKRREAGFVSVPGWMPSPSERGNPCRRLWRGVPVPARAAPGHQGKPALSRIRSPSITPPFHANRFQAPDRSKTVDRQAPLRPFVSGQATPSARPSDVLNVVQLWQRSGESHGLFAPCRDRRRDAGPRPGQHSGFPSLPGRECRWVDHPPGTHAAVTVIDRAGPRCRRTVPGCTHDGILPR